MPYSRTRSGQDWNDKFSSVVSTIQALNNFAVIIDGEAVVFNAKEFRIFQLLLRPYKAIVAVRLEPWLIFSFLISPFPGTVFVYFIRLLDVDPMDLANAPKLSTVGLELVFGQSVDIIASCLGGDLWAVLK